MFRITRDKNNMDIALEKIPIIWSWIFFEHMLFTLKSV